MSKKREKMACYSRLDNPKLYIFDAWGTGANETLSCWLKVVLRGPRTIHTTKFSIGKAKQQQHKPAD
jgi:hypothetical protein